MFPCRVSRKWPRRPLHVLTKAMRGNMVRLYADCGDVMDSLPESVEMSGCLPHPTSPIITCIIEVTLWERSNGRDSSWPRQQNRCGWFPELRPACCVGTPL